MVAYPPLTVRTFDGGVPVKYVYLTMAAAIPKSDFTTVETNNRSGSSVQVQAPNQVQLGSLDGGELFAEIVPQTLVELVLVEIGCEIRRVELIGRLAVFLVRAPLERALDPRALGRQ